jgi:hypothetical protein
MANNDRAEYFARYNLEYDVPFESYTNGIVSYNEVSNSSRGTVRWAREDLYNHYVMIKGQDAPWTTQYLNLTVSTVPLVGLNPALVRTAIPGTLDTTTFWAGELTYTISTSLMPTPCAQVL